MHCSNPTTFLNHFVTKREDRLPKWRSCLLSVQGLDRGMRNIVMIYPSNPKRIQFQMYVLELLGKKTVISSFDNKDRQAPFIFW